MEDDLRNFFKGLLFLAAPIGLQLLANWLTQKRENEVFELRVQQTVQKEVQKLLNAPRDI